MKRFSDFAINNIATTGEKIKIDDVLGKEIEVVGYKIADSKYSNHENDKVLTLMFKLNSEDKILFTVSKVLIDQAEKYQDEMPFLATIKRVNKFYTFT